MIAHRTDPDLKRPSAPALAAVLWDVDGTLAETERDGHLPAFNAAFAACGLPWRWTVSHYRALLAIAGGRERLEHDLVRRADAPQDAAERAALAERIHRCKQAIFAERSVRHAPPLRDGVLELIRDCDEAGVALGIATTTSRRNVAALLSAHLGAGWQRRFACVLGAEDAPRKKPDPLVYDLALRRLGIRPEEAVAIEDSPNGAAAARAAGIAVVVTRSLFFPDAPIPGALACGPTLGSTSGWTPVADGSRIRLQTIRRWLRDRQPAVGSVGPFAARQDLPRPTGRPEHIGTLALPFPLNATSTRSPARA